MKKHILKLLSFILISVSLLIISETNKIYATDSTESNDLNDISVDDCDLVIYLNNDTPLLYSNGEQIGGPKVDGLDVEIYTYEHKYNVPLTGIK